MGKTASGGYNLRMLAPLLAIALAGSQTPLPKSWYGPARATFEVQYAGNPYDPAENDIRVRFFGTKGQVLERIAYFSDGAWSAILVSPEQDRYRAVLVRNGKETDAQPTQRELATQTRLPGFVKVDPQNPSRFRRDDAFGYFPIGHNLGWQTDGSPPLADHIRTMAESGLNWTRIWSTSRDAKDPWIPAPSALVVPGQLWDEALDRWAEIVAVCHRSRVDLQMVLFDQSGLGPTHPWSVAKGGFLTDPGAFFTDAEAKRRAKMWLRYAVARYAWTPHLMAWELLGNPHADSGEGNSAEIVLWHEEMAAYIRSIDPHGHLIATGSTASPRLGAIVDYRQMQLPGAPAPDDLKESSGSTEKPLLIARFGAAATGEGERARLRDALFGGIFANQPGTPMYWPWDQTHALGLYPEFRAAARAAELGRLADHPNRRVASVWVGDAAAATLGQVDWLLLRTKVPDSTPTLRLRGLPVAEGTYRATVLDLDTLSETVSQVRVKDFAASVEVPPRASDVAIALLRPPSP